MAQSIYHAYANMGSQPYLSFEQAAELIRTKPTRATVRRWTKTGKRGPDGRSHVLPTVRIRDEVMIYVDALNAFLNRTGLA